MRILLLDVIPHQPTSSLVAIPPHGEHGDLTPTGGANSPLVVGTPSGLIGAANSGRDEGDRTEPTGAANSRRPLADILPAITAIDTGVQRTPFATSKLRVEADRIIVGDVTYRLDDDGFGRLCRRLRAPADYLSRLPASLQTRVLEHHLRQATFTDRKLNDHTSAVVTRDGTFLDLARADLYSLRGEEVLQAVRDGVGADAASLEVQNFLARPATFHLDLVSPRIAEDVRPGDIIQGGIRLEHSLVGDVATTVMTYVVRLRCTNGLVQRECVHQRGGPRSGRRTRRLSSTQADAGEKQYDQIRNLVGETWRHVREKLDAIRRLGKEKVDVRKTLEQFLRQARMYSVALMELLEQAWAIEERDPTSFGLLNALTRVATHATEVSARQRQALARLAGVFANRHVHICPHCFNLVSGE